MSALDLDGLSDAQLRLFAVRCARRVHDPRFIETLDVAERHAKGEVTAVRRRAAAWAAAWAAAAAVAAATAEAAAEAARWAAARDEAAAAARDEAAAAAWSAAWDAAWTAERAEQQKILDKIREVKP